VRSNEWDRLQRHFHFRFRPPFVNSHESRLSAVVEMIAALFPLLGTGRQASRHGIPVHILEFLDPLLVSPHVEVIKAVLPEVYELRFQLTTRMPHLFEATSCNAKFQRGQHPGGIATFGFAHEEMKVFGHNNITHHDKVVTSTYLFQVRHEFISPFRSRQVGKSVVATTSNEVEMKGTVVTLEAAGHESGIVNARRVCGQ
jgi:hypothetical protein